jgi:quercetin dioxygenase-like cupin family protein
MSDTASPATHTDVYLINLNNEIAEAGMHRPWPSGVYSKTLLKRDDQRVVLIFLDKDATIHEHHADGSISVQVLKGHISFRAADQEHDLSASEIISLGPSVRHGVKAREESVLLLTISWPASQTLQSMSHRGYGS